MCGDLFGADPACYLTEEEVSSVMAMSYDDFFSYIQYSNCSGMALAFHLNTYTLKYRYAHLPVFLHLIRNKQFYTISNQIRLPQVVSRTSFYFM